MGGGCKPATRSPASLPCLPCQAVLGCSSYCGDAGRCVAGASAGAPPTCECECGWEQNPEAGGACTLPGGSVCSAFPQAGVAAAPGPPPAPQPPPPPATCTACPTCPALPPPTTAAPPAVVTPESNGACPACSTAEVAYLSFACHWIEVNPDDWLWLVCDYSL
jgi:hypothetical protein